MNQSNYYQGYLIESIKNNKDPEYIAELVKAHIRDLNNHIEWLIEECNLLKTK